MNIKKDKKGNVGTWLAIGVGIVGGLMIWAVAAITLQAFRDSQTASTLAYNITNGGLTFLSNASSQLGTAGTILGVSLLLVIVGAVGIGGYMAYKKTQ